MIYQFSLYRGCTLYPQVVFTFLLYTTVVHSQDRTTRHFISSNLTQNHPLWNSPPYKRLSHAHTPGCPCLSLTTANGDSKLSEFKLLSQALPILVMWLYYFAGNRVQEPVLGSTSRNIHNPTAPTAAIIIQTILPRSLLTKLLQKVTQSVA